MSVKKFIYKKGLNILFIFEYLILLIYFFPTLETYRMYSNTSESYSLVDIFKINPSISNVLFPIIFYILLIVGFVLSIISLLKNNKILDIINFPIYYILLIVGIFAVTSLSLERYLAIIAIICFAVKGIYLYLLSLDKYAEWSAF